MPQAIPLGIDKCQPAEVDQRQCSRISGDYQVFVIARVFDAQLRFGRLQEQPELLFGTIAQITLIDRHSGDTDLVDTVFVDNFAGGYSAAEHLIRLGHRRMAAISGPLTVSVATERLAGFEAGLGTAGLRLEPTLVRAGDFKQASGYAHMQSLLVNHRDQMDAVFVANDLMTLGALTAINAAGLRIPGDVSVVGFDDMPWAASLNPPLTTIGQPGVEMGEIAGRLVLERLGAQRAAPPRHVLLQPRLVVRSSTRPATRVAQRGMQTR